MEKNEISFEMAYSNPVPDFYHHFRSSMFQLFMIWADGMDFEGVLDLVGVFMSYTELFKRTYPDNVPAAKDTERFRGKLTRNSEDIIKEAQIRAT